MHRNVAKLGRLPVLQYEESPVDLAHRQLSASNVWKKGCSRSRSRSKGSKTKLGLLTSSSRHQELNLLLGGEGPHLEDGLAQLHVRLVHLLRRPHLDAQVLPDQGEEGGGEVDLALVVQRHVHPNQLLVGQAIRAFGSEAQRGIHILEHVIHFGIVDPSPVL